MLDVKLGDQCNHNHSREYYMTSTVGVYFDENRVLHQLPVGLGVEGFSYDSL